MDALAKIRHSLDAQFGRGAQKALPPDTRIVYSRRTGRIREVRSGTSGNDDDDNNNDNDVLFGVQRPDGGIAVSMVFAQMMITSKMTAPSSSATRTGGAIASHCIEVSAEAAPFVAEGRSVFCKHVARCGKQVRAQSDILVTHEGSVIAVGRALLSCEIISVMDSGVAVKVRDSLKGRRG